MTLSNYQNNTVDLDYTYISSNDPNYGPGLPAAVSNRKMVEFGQQLLTQTYPIGNVNNAVNYAQALPGVQVDQDAVIITGVTANAVFYKNKNNTSQSLIRSNFSLIENYPQTPAWQLINTNRTSPAQIGSTYNWAQIACGYQYTVALQSDGTIWGWGLNSWGQLGTSNQTNYSSPVRVSSSLWARISSINGTATVAVATNGTLWGWGNNSWGQLGLGNLTHKSSPTQINSGTFFYNPIAGPFTTYITSVTGALYCWGASSYGQLGLNTTAGSSALNQIGSSTWNRTSAGISAGYYHAAGIQTNGTLWTWGNNSYNQIGNNTTTLTNILTPVQIGALTTWKQVSCGYFHNAAIQSNGTLWTWGTNSFGQLGQNNQTTYSSPVQVGALSTWSLVYCGAGNFTAAIQSNGTLWAWGNNSYGQLGVGSAGTAISSPVQVGTLSSWTSGAISYYVSTMIQNDGSLWTWGLLSYGALGLQPSAISVNKIVYGL